MKRLAVVALALVAGCAHTRKGPPRVETVTMEPMVFAAQPNGTVETVDAASLFERAGAAYGNKDFDGALALFDRVVREWPGSRYVVPSLYNAGLALEGKGDLAAAAERYRRITVEHPDAKDALDAWYRLGFVQAEAKDWPAAVDTYGQILARKDLGLGDRLEALARRGVAQFNAQDILAAEHTFARRARLLPCARDRGAPRLRLLRRHGRLLPRRVRARAISRCCRCACPRSSWRAISRPRRACSSSPSRASSTPCASTTSSGRRPPASRSARSIASSTTISSARRCRPRSPARRARSTSRRCASRSQTLLQKAISIHEKNVLMAERTGEQNEWVRRSNEQMEQLRKLLVPGPVAPQPPDAATPPAEPPIAALAAPAEMR